MQQLRLASLTRRLGRLVGRIGAWWPAPQSSSVGQSRPKQRRWSLCPMSWVDRRWLHIFLRHSRAVAEGQTADGSMALEERRPTTMRRLQMHRNRLLPPSILNQKRRQRQGDQCEKMGQGSLQTGKVGNPGHLVETRTMLYCPSF